MGIYSVVPGGADQCDAHRKSVGVPSISHLRYDRYMHSYNVTTEHGGRYGVYADSLRQAVEAFDSDPRYGCARRQDLVAIILVDNGWV